MKKKLEDLHLGDVLRFEFMDQHGMSSDALARETGLTVGCINELILGNQNMTAEIDVALSRYFGLSDGFWLGMQNTFYEMETERKKSAQGVTRAESDKSPTTEDYWIRADERFKQSDGESEKAVADHNEAIRLGPVRPKPPDGGIFRPENRQYDREIANIPAWSKNSSN